MSSPSVPQFPLFGLPYLGIRNVIDCWNPFELCNFYMISKKTKEIAIKKSKRQAAVIEFDSNWALKVVLKLNEDQKYQWTFHDVKSSEKTYEEVCDDHNVSVYSTDKVSVMLRTFNRFMELFNCSFGEIQISSKDIAEKQFQSIIDWFNTNYQKYLPIVFVSGNNQEMFNMVFIQSFRGKVGTLMITDSLYFERARKPMRVKVNKNLEIEDFRSCNFMQLNLNCLLSLNSVEAFGGTNLTNEDLRKFLISWQSGKTNSKLRKWRFSTPNELNWKTILQGLSPVLRDPRTTKRAYLSRNYRRTHWIHGGVDIQRIDGKILTIPNCGGHSTDEENEEVPQDAVDMYEKIKKWDWNNEEEEEDADDFEECNFDFYVL